MTTRSNGAGQEQMTRQAGAAAPAEPAQKAARSRIKVLTWNLRNLANPGVDYYPGEKYSPAEFERKIGWINGQLGTMDADVAGFQEVFHKEALVKAVGKAMGKDVRVIVTPPDDDAQLQPPLKPRVALATRLPIIGEPTVIRDIPQDATLHFLDGDGKPTAPLPITSFSRPVLRVELELWKNAAGAAEKAVVFVVHLKSMTPEIFEGQDDEDPMVYALGEARAQMRRTAEAAGIRSLVRRELEGTRTPVIVLGDCNAGTPSVVASIMSGPAPARYLKIEDKQRLWDRMLYDAIELQSRQSLNGTYYTHIFNGRYEALDHILLSEEFYDRNPAHIARVEYVRLFTDHLVDGDLCPDRIPSWQSDHGAVVVTLHRDSAAPAIDSVPIPELAARAPAAAPPGA
ncbi:MAG TPA: endonuclease/exonuclease/phosphatase family protein [Kofleriaceae bacterium]